MAEATVHQLMPTASEEEVRVKNCIKCGLDKPLALFRPNKRLKDGRSNVCYECHNKKPATIAGRHKYVGTARGRYQKAKWVARDRELEFTLSLESYTILVSQPCYYCKGKLGEPVKKGCGLDRLNSNVGYVIGNVVSCCGVCNRMKSDWMTPEEAQVAVDAILRLRASRQT